MLAVPATATDPTGPWSAFVVARDPSGNPIAGLPITMTASQGTLSVSSGTTDANGSFSTTITPPAGISATEAVGLVATSGGQAVSASLLFTGVSTAAARTGNSAAALRRKLGVEAATPAASSAATIPVAIGISIASPGSTSPFATPNYCYTTAALSSTETSQCAALYQEQSIALQPTNPFQAACNVANVADTAVDVGECVGTAVTVVSCAVSASGVGSVATLGAADAVCAATVDLTASTLAPDCAEFIINEVTNYFSPKAATAEEVVELTVEPSENPLDYAVALCDLASSSGSQSSGAVVAPVAGNGVQGNSNGLALSISLNSPTGIAIDASGNVYFDDDGNNVIRELNIATNEVTTVVGTGATGYTGDNGPAASATLNHPTQLAFDADYNLYIADADNNVVRKVSGGIITTVAGTGIAGYSGDGSAAVHAMLDYPDSIFLDAAGNLYISDASNNRIRKVTSNGVINTVAGNGIGSYGGDNGPALDAELNGPTRVVVDSVGNLYISDLHNNRIRKVNGSNEIISTIAGNGISGDEGDGGAATSAELNEPVSLALDTSGNVYIADLGNQRIRVVNTQTAAATLLGVAVQPGTIATVVGGGAQSDLYAGAVLSVSLLYPTGLLTDKTGNLYFADADNNIILRAGGGN
jgi:sugar lactone lactonase YvrE